jgi:phosphatidylglycerol:prolipoprotein diacylglycerol transferase
LNGCCLGKPFAGVFATRDGAGTMRWPAPAVEGAFQIVMLITVLLLQRRGLLRDRLFFLYLAAYGLFRFAARVHARHAEDCGGLSGYQLIALGMAVLGGVMMCRRTKSMLAPAVAEGSLRP